ncbi:MAG: diacylglycerol kinase family lipid kinase [Anaerolineae bacterium]|nr:diacylglycerol kinase family lipid kinase [Anaerolineae bacterium]
MGKGEISVIVNPTAAGGAVGHEWPDLRSHLLARGLRFRDVFTEAPGHATQLALEAVHQGCQIVVAVGGDGTVNEVVNGLCNGNGLVPATQLAIVSRGTGCDLVRTLGLGDVRRTISALTERETTRTIDVGEILMERDGRTERRLFLNAAGLGFDGEVVEGLLRSRVTGRRIGGTVPYLLEVVQSIMHYDNKRVRATLDGDRMEGLFTSFFACNGRYFAGGMKVAPQADMSDGLFDVVILHALSRLGLLARLPTVYFGWHTVFRQIEIRRARELKVESEDHILIQADGELVGTVPATLRVIPKALKVRV